MSHDQHQGERDAADRRKRPTSPLDALRAGGRRKEPRRCEDRAGNYFVDRFDATTLAMIVGLLALTIVDGVFTIELLDASSEEVNPLMALSAGPGPARVPGGQVHPHGGRSCLSWSCSRTTVCSAAGFASVTCFPRSSGSMLPCYYTSGECSNGHLASRRFCPFVSGDRQRGRQLSQCVRLPDSQGAQPLAAAVAVSAVPVGHPRVRQRTRSGLALATGAMPGVRRGDLRAVSARRAGDRGFIRGRLSRLGRVCAYGYLGAPGRGRCRAQTARDMGGDLCRARPGAVHP